MTTFYSEVHISEFESYRPGVMKGQKFFESTTVFKGRKSKTLRYKTMNEAKIITLSSFINKLQEEHYKELRKRNKKETK